MTELCVAGVLTENRRLVQADKTSAEAVSLLSRTPEHRSKEFRNAPLQAKAKASSRPH